MDYKVKDKSGDKKYFTIIPNYILNHSDSTTQALYMQLKRLAGEDGTAYPSQGFLMKQLGISKPTLRKKLKYLVSNGWINYLGWKKVGTAGGVQRVKEYEIVDLWEKNIQFYKGGKNNTNLAKAKGGKNRPKGGEKIDPLIITNIKNINKKQDEAKASGLKSLREILKDKGIISQSKGGASYRWQDTAVRWWDKLSLKGKPTASWFKIFRAESRIAERACSWASDSGGDDLEKLTYWAYHQLRKNGKIVFSKDLQPVANKKKEGRIK